MAQELLASKIIVREEEPTFRALPTLPTAVLAMVGLAERGPLNTATRVSSLEEYARTFGTYYTGAQMTLAIRQFFLNGGRQAVIVRVLGAGSATSSVDLADSVPATTLTLDASSPGAWGDTLTVSIEAASSGVATEFNLILKKDSVVVERFPNLTMDSTADNYAVDVLNNDPTASLYVVATGVLTTRPVNVADAALATGSDGAAVADSTFDGSVADTGLDVLDPVQGITLLAIPDRATTTVHLAMITFCEVTREGAVWAVLDPPASQSPSGIVTHIQSLTGSEHFGLYWPRVKVPNPSTAIFGSDTLLTVPPSGSIAGMIARNDTAKQEGPFAQPAGVDEGRLFNVVNLEADAVLRVENRDIVFPARVNPITFSPGVGIFVDGARTGLATGNFPSVGERRGVSTIETTLKIGLEFVRHKNNTPELRRLVARLVRALLLNFMRRGAFASKNPDTAFFVDVSDQLNSPTVIAQHRLLVRFGLATNSPAEFIELLVSKDTRAIDAELRARK